MQELLVAEVLDHFDRTPHARFALARAVACELQVLGPHARDHEGYLRALTRAGIPARPEYVREGTQSRYVARSIAEELLRLPEPPTAVFAASDTQALGVLEAAQELRVRVPENLSVVGFDDVETASYVGLTTVRQPLFESGRRGAELVLQALAGGALPARTETLPLDLVVRRTTGPPRP